MTDDTRIRQDLMNLLRFSAALQATRDTAVFDIADHPIHLTGRDLLDRHGAPLPGIAFGPGEDSWFSFARLRAHQTCGKAARVRVHGLGQVLKTVRPQVKGSSRCKRDRRPLDHKVVEPAERRTRDEVAGS